MKRLLFVFAVLSIISFTSVGTQVQGAELSSSNGGTSPYYTVIEQKSKVLDNGVLRAVVYYKLVSIKRYSDDVAVTVTATFKSGTRTLLDDTYTIIRDVDFSVHGNMVYFCLEATKEGPIPGIFLHSVIGQIKMD